MKEKVERLGIVREILRISTDFLRRIIAPVGGRRGVTLSIICPHCNSFPLEDFFGGYRRQTETATTRRSTAVGGAQSVEKNYEWRAHTHTRILVVQIGTNEDEANVFRAHAVPQGLCESLIQRAQSCWPTSREMVTVRFKTLLRVCNGIAGDVLRTV